MWFQHLTGFAEESPRQVRECLDHDEGEIVSLVNDRRMRCGILEVPSLDELRETVKAAVHSRGSISVSEVVADVQGLHADPANEGALFQVASQFNLLEMISPHKTPEDGVGIYEQDPTQGPACAIACGAGTIYRNYFALVNDRIGQTHDNQIDCLFDLGQALGNIENRLWGMRNGYLLTTRPALEELSRQLSGYDETELDRLRSLVRVGVMWQTEVTIAEAPHSVSQAYCSALPVSYNAHPAEMWRPFARLVLEAAYEATLASAVLNASRTGNNHVYLTLLGGGAFGNRQDWILDAIQRSLELYRNHDLRVSVVSYGASNPNLRRLLTH